MADEDFQLVVREGGRPGQIFNLGLPVLIIGRDPLADIAIGDREISRHHARLTRGDRGYELQDIGSTNGTFVDGQRLGTVPVVLRPGQIIRLGHKLSLIYRKTPSDELMTTMVGQVPLEPTVVSEPGALPSIVDTSALPPIFATQNPYVGPRAFEPDERQFFYGRDDEIAILAGLVLARRASLFFAQSGAGKSSLLRAGLIPDLTRQESVGRGRQARTYQKMRVLPILTVGGGIPVDMKASIANVYVFSALFTLKPDSNPDDLAGLTLSQGLSEYFTATEEPTALLLFDQFEELFTYHPDRWREREGFFRQVAQALNDYSNLHVLFTMREDYIAELTPYANLLPDDLRPRFRLERLKRDAALKAVTAPAERAGRSFAEGVAEELVDNLRRGQPGKMGQSGQPAEGAEFGAYVEPVHLQIVCRQLWEKLPGKRTVIESADVQEFGDVDQALIGFYEATLATVASRTDLSPRRLRAWFTDQLITPARTRGLVYRGETETEGLPNAAVDVLNDAYIIRASVRAGDIWYELAHDRLVEPIMEANQVWYANYQNPLEKAARVWLAAGRDPLRLLDGAQLEEAQAYADEHPNDVLPEEQEFLDKSCRQADFQAEQARLATRRRRLTIAAGLIVMAVLVIITAYAVGQAALANQAKLDARSAQAAAEESASLAATREAEAKAQRIVADAQKKVAEGLKEVADHQREEAVKLQEEADSQREEAVKQKAEAVNALQQAARSEASRLTFIARKETSEDNDQVALLLVIEARNVLRRQNIAGTGPTDRLLLQIAEKTGRSKGRIPIDPCILVRSNLRPEEWERFFTAPYRPICESRPVPEAAAREPIEISDPYELLGICYDGNDQACARAAEEAVEMGDPYFDLEICQASGFDPSLVDEVLPACRRAAAYAAAVDPGNPFDLPAPTAIRFSPAAGGFAVSNLDAELELNLGQELNLGDDTTMEVEFPAGFPFFGTTWNSVWVNSNGSITLDSGDPFAFFSSADLAAGLPRIAPLVLDLDPASGGAVLADVSDDRLVVTWDAVPQFGVSNSNTFQTVLHSDGTIDLIYGNVESKASVVGVAQGNGEMPANGIDLTADLPTTLEAGAIFEEFTFTEKDIFLLFDICEGGGVDRSEAIPECQQLLALAQEGGDPYALAIFCSLGDAEGDLASTSRSGCSEAAQAAQTTDDPYLYLEICRNGSASEQLADIVQPACQRLLESSAQADDPYLSFNICQEAAFNVSLADSALSACERAIELAASAEDLYLSLDICREGNFNVDLADAVKPACEQAAQLAVQQEDPYLNANICREGSFDPVLAELFLPACQAAVDSALLSEDFALLFEVCQADGVDRSEDIPECGTLLQSQDPYALAPFCSSGGDDPNTAAFFQESCARAVQLAGEVDDITLYLDICRAGGFGGDMVETVLPACGRAAELAQGLDDLILASEICRQGAFDNRVAEAVLPACVRLAAAATPISFGETVSGTLAGSGGDPWSFTATAGQSVVIVMNRTGDELDPFLMLIGPDGAVILTDDDSAGNLDSLIELMLGEPGTYTILALGLGSSTGAYELSLE